MPSFVLFVQYLIAGSVLPGRTRAGSALWKGISPAPVWQSPHHNPHAIPRTPAPVFPSPSLSNIHRVTRCSKLSIRTRKNLRPGLNVLHNESIPEPIARIIRTEVLEKVQQVPAEGRLRPAPRHETVHFDVTVQAVGEVEDDAADRHVGDGREGVAVCGQGRGRAVEAESDHYFEEVGGCGGVAEEGVVCG